MFREMRRYKQQMAESECLEFLKPGGRAALAFNGENGYPYCLPMDYYYDSPSGKIYVHSALEGHKIDSVKSDSRVCFTAWRDTGELNEWASYVDSVVIFATARIITDSSIISDILPKLAALYYPTSEEIEETMQSSAARTCLIELTPNHITGKHVLER